MTVITQGRYRARQAHSEADHAAVFDLRARCFRAGADDRDGFDPTCRHFLVEDIATQKVLGTCRMSVFETGQDIHQSYSAQYYDLAPLSGIQRPMAELGRFCVDPNQKDPDILRLAWGMLAGVFESHKVALLFGCSSFRGCNPNAFATIFQRLRLKHLAPAKWRPGVKSRHAVKFKDISSDAKHPQGKVPQLLRSYLSMGGWVSDHAVIDRDLGTLHVFTGLEIDKIPPARARSLRQVQARG